MPLCLYSTISSLAYLRGQRYYGGIHYAWCAPGDPSDQHDPANPPSSHPVSIYKRFLLDVESNDGHSGKIEQNRIGLTRGAEERFRQKMITQAQRNRIIEIVKRAEFKSFEPLMLVIPFPLVENLAKMVEPGDGANAVSEEYIISNLPRESFDVLHLAGMKS